MLTSRMAPTFTKSAILACLALSATPGFAGGNEDNHQLLTASAMFGRGLNTPLPSPVNHAILPTEIKVKVGGVVDFRLAGFHDIVIFKPGFTLDDLIDAGGGNLPSFPPVFVIPSDPAAPLPGPIASLADHIYYRGINPAGGPPMTPASSNPDNTFNRSEPVAFLEPGTYLVICNVRPHLLNGMFAHVKVLK